MRNLLPFQIDAINKIIEFYNSNFQNAKISLAVGLGTNKILVYAIKRILLDNDNCKILYLCGSNNEMLLFQDMLKRISRIDTIDFLPDIKDNGVFICNYNDILKNTDFDYNFFDLIICNDIHLLNDKNKYTFLDNNYKGKRLSINNTTYYNKLLEDYKLIFEYNLYDALNDGYLNTSKEKEFINNFLPLFLNNINFDNLEIINNVKDNGIDLTATYNKKKYSFIIKTYRTKYVSKNLIEASCNRIYSFNKNSNNTVILIVTSIVDNEFKEKILKEKNIEIWDIENLLFLCNNSQKLIQHLASLISYPIDDIKPLQPIKFVANSNLNKNINEEYYSKFEKELANCLPGKENGEDKKFEKICNEIVKYLFGTEFFQMSDQHKTKDDLFRMDMICSLKGTTEFWKFLMQFYNTKFVVFEYKNYSKPLSQNLIFIASKYLFPEALRNVAFIISRYGINKNAKLVVDSKIKSDRKLIINLTDKDLLIMVALKEQGKEPSDYLLEKVEKMLMSLSVY